LNFFVDKIPAFGGGPGPPHLPAFGRPDLRLFFLALALLAGACSRPAVDMMEAPPAALRGAAYVHAVEVSLGPEAKREVAAADARAATRGAPGDAGLSLDRLLTRLFKDGAAARGLRDGRALTLVVELDRLRITDAGGALTGRDDRLAGLVRLTDARTGAALATFYVDVDRRYPGLIGLAVREGGGAIRERLASAFVRHTLDQIAPPGRMDR
jgi:hypothetical protein